MIPLATTLRHNAKRRRTGFTLIEVGVSLVIIAAAMALVLQLGLWSMRHRARMASHFVAIEAASNVLEAARMTPWEALNDQWAGEQALPESMRDQLSDGLLAVRVEPVSSAPLTKRVIVEVGWTRHGGVQSPPVRLIGFVSNRAKSARQGQP